MTKQELETLKNTREWMTLVPNDMKQERYYNDFRKISELIAEGEK